ncbi:tumor necrosis factor ligand superfamily member 12-like isoform X2 [Polyodon spathula]|uniref:tumor necrosis factor ligand superfamily member 12-like isoform X2 n=1 Tax=Polyodon spathula TaxID=7913 RepID=UPI001B7E5DEB|nr:tumor necrosis factor ligand superfamily member 12-like isoform X2 [Polyodon spathula]
MQRFLPKKKLRRSGIWGVLALLALSVSLVSLSCTALSWGHARSLTRSLQTLQDRLVQADLQREATVQLLMEQRNLQGKRVKRAADLKKKRSHKAVVAAHFEIKPENTVGASSNIIKGWTEVDLNTSAPVNYDSSTGGFTVQRAGLYYLYCQIHFMERESAYLKLQVYVGKVPLFSCLQSYGTTPSSSPSTKLGDFFSCHVSGLVRLTVKEKLTVQTFRGVNLRSRHDLNYFVLFKVK